MMESADVIAVVQCLSAAGVAVWLDGGWGVDALLGAQTRPHDDLDLVAAADDDALLPAALAPLGYAPHIDERPTRYVLRAPGDRRIDVHPVIFDAEGGGLQAQPVGPPFRYPPEGLAGFGQIVGGSVRCLTPELQLRCHSGYEPDDDDRRDMRLLCARFGLALPERFADAPSS